MCTVYEAAYMRNNITEINLTLYKYKNTIHITIEITGEHANMNKILAILITSGFLCLLSGCGVNLPEQTTAAENADNSFRLETFSGGKEEKEAPDIYNIFLVHHDGTREEFLADHMRYRSYGIELHLIEQNGDSVDKNIIISLGSDYLIERLKKEMVRVKIEV